MHSFSFSPKEVILLLTPLCSSGSQGLERLKTYRVHLNSYLQLEVKPSSNCKHVLNQCPSRNSPVEIFFSFLCSALKFLWYGLYSSHLPVLKSEHTVMA